MEGDVLVWNPITGKCCVMLTRVSIFACILNVVLSSNAISASHNGFELGRVSVLDQASWCQSCLVIDVR